MLLHFFLVKLKAVGAKRSTEIVLRFKASGASVDFTGSEPVLSAFCFPLGPEAVPPKEYIASEEYTFTLTHGDGKRFQGFCRKVLPPAPKIGSKLRFPQVLCIISEYPWCMMYFKVLQVMEQLLRSGDSSYDRDPADLPPSSNAFKFLQELGEQLNTNPSPGQIIRIPFPADVSLLGISPPRNMSVMSTAEPVRWDDGQLEFQVPPDCGNGKWNCGISLARLLWSVPVSAMLTLISSMLLERRIIIIGSSRDTVTAAVQAAAALLYPFRWHHIYLPLLPKQLKDYLAAPMPFIVGLPAQMLSCLKGLSVDEVTLLDLDLGKCDPAPNSARDDAVHLPWKAKLEVALAAAYAQLRSPTEFESSPLISGIMQEYFLKLVGNYHSFIHEDIAPSRAATHTRMHASASASSSSARRDGGEASSSSRDHRDNGDTALRGHGKAFDQDAFIAHFRRNDKAQHFLAKFRHSQMYEVFIQERLERAAQHSPPQDAFEERLARCIERRKSHRLARLGVNVHQPASSRMSTLKKQRDDGREAGAGARPNKSCSANSTPVAGGLDPASFFEDDSDSDWVYDRDLLTRKQDSPGHPRDLRTCSAMPAIHQLQHLRAEFEEAEPGGGGLAIRHSGSKPDLRTDLSRASDPIRDQTAAEKQRQQQQQQQLGLAQGDKAAPAASAGSGSLVFSFQSGERHYEGNLTSVMKAMWSDRKSPTQTRTQSTLNPAAAGTNQVGGEDGHDDGLTDGRSSLPEMTRTATGGSGDVSTAPMFRRNASELRTKSVQVHRGMPETGTAGFLGLDGGRLKQPPAPSRPLHVVQPLSTMIEVPSMTSLAEAADSQLQQAPALMSGLQEVGGSGGLGGKAGVGSMVAGVSARDMWDPFGISSPSGRAPISS